MEKEVIQQSQKRLLKLSFNKIINETEKMGNSMNQENNSIYHESIFLINLLSYINKEQLEDSKRSKALSILSLLLFRIKDINGLANVVNQMQLKLNSKNRQDALFLLDIYAKIGTLLSNSNHLLYSYYYLDASNSLYQKFSQSIEMNQSEFILNSFNLSLKKLNSNNQSYLIDYKSKQEEMIKECDRINHIYETAVAKAEGKKNDNKDMNNEDKIFLINVKWLENANEFALMYKDKIKQSDEEVKEFLSLAFDNFEGQKSNYLRRDTEKPNGCFPLEINNYTLIDFFDVWKETDIENYGYENELLSSSIEENKDYYCLYENDWNFLKMKFGCTNEIKRYCLPTIMNKSISESDVIVNGNDKEKDKNKNNSITSLYEIHLTQLDVLILNRELAKQNLNYLKVKTMQFSKGITIKQFKEKIIRCLDIKDSSTSAFKITIYNTNGLNNETLLTMLISYSINCTQFQIQLEEIIIKDEDSISTLIQIKNCPFLLIEVIKEEEKDENDQPVPFINTNIDKCYNCSKEININVKSIQCNECAYNYYCNPQCLKQNLNHQQIHEWQYWTLKLKQIQQYDLYTNTQGKRGLMGLVNRGNTCFMASGLQCLSNTEDLTKFFLSEMYSQELNQFSHFGSKGEISKAYYKLLQRLWNANDKYIDINTFRVPFAMNTGYYRDNSQQDSQEMVSILLDRLHEDLNRINKKPYFDMKEQMPNEDDQKASERWWKCHKMRDDSIIVDLFHGQYKATIICPECPKVNITYDPFIFLTLPIPSEVNKIIYKFFPYHSPQTCINETMLFFPDTKVMNLKKQIIKKHSEVNIDCIEVVLLSKDKTIKNILSDEQNIQSLVQNYEEIVCYEKKSKESIVVYTYPIKRITTTSYFFQPSIDLIYQCYPWAFSLNVDCTFKEIWLETYNQMQKLIKLPQNDIYTMDQINTWDFPKVLSSFSLQFSHQFKNKTCTFCNGYNPLCEIFPRYNFKTKYKIIINKVSPIKPNSSNTNSNNGIVFLAEILVNSPLKAIYSNIQMPLEYKSSPSLQLSKSNLQLQDCFELFQLEEKLSLENTWYCSNCKKHQEAWKKLDIYNAPNYLIIHLKRFKIRSNNVVMAFFNNHKNNVFIDFPKDNLDLRQFVIGPNANKAQYDLYAVVNHSGGLNMGHYFAYCKHQREWYCFNDEKVAVIPDKDVVSSNAYLLFYKKRVMDSF